MVIFTSCVRGWLLLCLYTSTSCQQPLTVLPPDTGDYCPARDVCIWKSQQPVEYMLSGTFSSCCTDCSCNSACGDERTCCFPELDLTKGLYRKYKSCMQTSIPEIAATKTYKYIHYLMVDSNPDDGCIVAVPEIPDGEQCGNVTSGWWGSQYPYYSESRKIIFINKYCAKCHNARDAMNSIVTVQGCDLAEINEAFLSNKNTKEELKKHSCTISFSFRDFESELQSEQCYLNIVDTCKSNFVIPDDCKLTRNETERACTSGLFSPYIGRALYSNVFCAWCNEQHSYDTMFCSVAGSRGSKADASAFSILLDTDILNAFQRASSSQSEHQRLKHACFSKNNQAECRPLLCPKDRILVNGECIFLSKRLLRYRLKVTLKLILDSENKLQISDLQDQIRENNGRILQLSAWPNKWLIDKLHVKDNSHKLNRTFAEELVVQMIHKYASLSLSEELNKIYSNLQDTRFVLSIGNASYVFRQFLAGFTGVAHIGNIKRQLIKGIESITNQTVYDKLFYDNLYIVMPVHSLVSINKNVQAVTQTHFCDLVQLTKDEYIMYATKVVYYTVLDVFLFDSEFTVTIDDDGETVVNMCVEKSVFRVSDTAAATIIGAVANLNMIAFLVWFSI